MDGAMGGGVSSRPTAPAARLIRCDTQAIVSEHPCFFGVGFPLRSTPTLHIDVVSRRYKACQGWYQKIEGGAEDFSKLSLRLFDRGRKGTTLLLHWRDSQRPPLALHSASWEEARFLGQTISALLELPFDAAPRPSTTTASPIARLIKQDATTILFERIQGETRFVGFTLLLIGAVLLGIAVWFLCNAAVPGNYAGLNFLYATFCLMIGFPFAVGGYVSLHTTLFSVDIPNRTYRESCIWWPFSRVKEGRVDEFDRLALWSYDNGKRAMTLELHWRDWKRSPLALHTANRSRQPASNREDAREQGLAVARNLHLNFVDEEGKPIFPHSAPPPPGSTR